MKKILIILLFSILLSGCGEKTTYPSDSYDSSYESEDVYPDVDEDTEVEEEYSEGENAALEEPGEISGIIGMLYESSPAYGTKNLQIISINPDNGTQRIIADWNLKTSANTSTDETEMFFYLPEKSSLYGNNRDWLTDDFSKLGVTAIFANNERHAGWLNRKGEFFDVTESVGAIHESDFSNPDPVYQNVLGFNGDKLGLYEDFSNGEQKHYYVPVNNAVADAMSEVEVGDWYFDEAFVSTVNDPYPTSWIDATTCIADVYDHIGHPRSIQANIETGETTEYLPESERYNWSGVLSPSGDTIAFLSVSQQSSGIVELYTVPFTGGEPTKIELEANEDLLLDTTTLTNDDLYGPTSVRNYTSYHFYLLEWK